MDNKPSVRFNRIFWISIVILLIWIWLFPGLRSIFNNFFDWTTFLLLGLSLSVIVAIVIVSRTNIMLQLEEKRFERSQVGVTMGLFIGVTAYYFYQLIRPTQSIAANTLFWRIHSLGALLLLGYIMWQVVVSFRITDKDKE